LGESIDNLEKARSFFLGKLSLSENSPILWEFALYSCSRELNRIERFSCDGIRQIFYDVEVQRN
ncbi:hypothetical protein BVY04_05085, partial [bacterium M21]